MLMLLRLLIKHEPFAIHPAANGPTHTSTQSYIGNFLTVGLLGVTCLWFATLSSIFSAATRCQGSPKKNRELLILLRTKEYIYG